MLPGCRIRIAFRSIRVELFRSLDPRGTAAQPETRADMSNQRPLSPNIQVYRWQITMTMSILHRVSGVVLVLGAGKMLSNFDLLRKIAID